MSLENLINFSKKLVEQELVTGSGGNVSLRKNNYIYLSPSGYSLNEIEKDDFVKMNLKGKIKKGEKPTSEWRMHLAIYQERSDKIIMHAHPLHLIAFLSTEENLKPITPQHALFLEKAAALPYIIPGGRELASAVREKASENKIIFLQNHGIVVSGKNPKEAFTKIKLAEEVAKIQLLALSIGKPRFLAKKEISKIKKLGLEKEKNCRSE